MLVHEVDVESLPRDLPERIDVEIEHLAVGHSLHVSDLVVPDGVRVLTSQDQVIVLIAHKVEEAEPEDDEEDLEDALEGEVVDEE